MKDINIEDFRIKSQVSIKDLPTFYDLGVNKKKIERELRTVSEELADIQNTMYAHGKYAGWYHYPQCGDEARQGRSNSTCRWNLCSTYR